MQYNLYIKIMQWTLIFFIGLGFAAGEYRTKCYFCTSATEPRCNNTNLYYNYEYLLPTECDYQKIETTLHRIHQGITQYGGQLQFDSDAFDCIKVERIVNNHRTVIRGCQVRQVKRMNHCLQIQSSITDASEIGYCGVCNTDGCNFGPKTTENFCIIILGIFLIYQLYLLRKF